jgi:hypothetical protein
LYAFVEWALDLPLVLCSPTRNRSIDSKIIADLMRTNFLPESYIAPKEVGYLAAISMLFDWLVIGQVSKANPRQLADVGELRKPSATARDSSPQAHRIAVSVPLPDNQPTT